jgi:hypothetical protein
MEEERTPIQQTVLTDIERLESFVHPEKLEKYFSKWGFTKESNWVAESKEQYQNSFNWASFFLSGFWMGYRKMHIENLILTVVLYLLTFLASLVSDVLENAVTVGMWIAWGFIGNQMYLYKASREIIKIKALGLTPHEELSRLSKAGGTSGAHVFIGIGIMLGVFAVFYFLGMS